MKLSNKKAVQQIVCTLADWEINQVILCPGSRNAPFIISFNQHPDFTCTSIRDERSAGFFALGMALETQKPVVIVCTSGSAVLNFAPALVEAYYLRVPIIVITADRPEKWIDQGDGQTINQKNIYQNYIRASYNLDGDADGTSLIAQLKEIEEGLAIAQFKNKGPVHFNVYLNEPLFETESVNPEKIDNIFSTKNDLKPISKIDFKQLAAHFSSTPKVMILVGQMQPDAALNQLISEFAAFKNVVILTESTSNIHHPDFIENIDRCIMPMAESEAASFFPDLLITIGGAIVSKKIKSLLRKYKPSAHWNIHPYDAKMDTYQSLTLPIALDAFSFLKNLLPEIAPSISSDFQNRWIQWSSILEAKHQEYCRQVDYTDFYVFSEIIKSFPGDTILHLGNSSPIRYAQLFDNRDIMKTHCNRGTSGIDGCTSTAMGAAFANPTAPVVLVSGDIGFMYDSNALWNDQTPENLKIIVINNSGGGIFRFIPGPATTHELNTFFEAEQTRSVKKLAEFHQWSYLSADSKITLKEALSSFFDPKNKRAILEIFTPQMMNAPALSGYFKYLEI